MRSEQREHEIDIKKAGNLHKERSTCGYNGIYMKRSKDLNDESMRSTWIDHKIYMERSWDLKVENIRSA